MVMKIMVCGQPIHIQIATTTFMQSQFFFTHEKEAQTHIDFIRDFRFDGLIFAAVSLLAIEMVFAILLINNATRPTPTESEREREKKTPHTVYTNKLFPDLNSVLRHVYGFIWCFFPPRISANARFAYMNLKKKKEKRNQLAAENKRNKKKTNSHTQPTFVSYSEF